MTLRAAVIYVALWTPLVLIYAILIGSPNDMSVAEAVSGGILTVGMAALLGLPALWWTRRLAGRRAQGADAPPWAPLPAHLFGALAYTVSWAAYIVEGIRRGLGSWGAAFDAVRPWIAWQLFFGIVVYAVVAGATWVMLSSARSRAREEQLREVEAQRTRAELAMLRARVEPHFLYNALHTATALVRRDPEASEHALEQLAMLLRYVLDPDRGARELVPLDEELRFVELYLAIERARLGERLHVHWDIDDDARDMPVPSLSLQPLVENAIRHGISRSAAGGRITISAALDDARLTLAVHNDSHESTTPASDGTGIGLDALRRRLAAWYRGAASLDVIDAPGRGFTVTMHVPV
jgi:hypothetical protein